MENLEVLKKIFDQFHEAIYIVDQFRKIVYFNPEAEKLTGFSRIEMENSFCYDNKLNHITEQGVNICIEGCLLAASIKENVVKEHFVYLHHKQGHRIKVHVRTIPIHNQKGVVEGAIEVFSDKTEKNLYLEEMKIRDSLFFIDALTVTFNRHYLINEIPTLISKNKQSQIGVAFIDIDKFKNFNDDYGHHLGDLVLSEISKTISKNLTGKDSLIRYGGDEFVIIMFAANQEEVDRIINKIDMLIKATIIRFEGKEFIIEASIGYTILKDNEDINLAIARADLAMYEAKNSQLNKPHFAK